MTTPTYGISLVGKTALVTGGNTGIGRSIAIELARAGADVAITYYSNHTEETVNEIRAIGRNSSQFKLDASISEQVNKVIPQVAESLGGHIDILINNAGHLIGRQPTAEMTDEHWHTVIDVNLSSAFYCTRATIPFMNRGWGRIVNMSSLAGRNGAGPGAVAYAASKAGLFGLTRGLAKELAAQGINVTAVAPGLILNTPFHETFTSETAKQATIAGIPLKRGGTPEEVATTVLYLASDMASFVTGEIIEINGGAWFV